MVCLLNQSYISQSPWDIRKDLLQQLHWLITRRGDRGSARELQRRRGGKKIKSKAARTNKGVKTEQEKANEEARGRNGFKGQRQLIHDLEPPKHPSTEQSIKKQTQTHTGIFVWTHKAGCVTLINYLCDSVSA